jgi:hypothetical protein
MRARGADIIQRSLTKEFPTTTKTMQDLFIHALSDVYSAEKQLTKALPKLARASTHVTPPRFHL